MATSRDAESDRRGGSPSSQGVGTGAATNVLDPFVARSRQLYSLPSVAMRVVELTSRPDVDTHELKRCVEQDPALTAKVLRVVNSSLFALSGKVADLQQAIGLLGIKTLKLLVLGFSLPKELFDGIAADVLGRFWRRTLVRSVVARELATRWFETPGEDAFVAGLLQDLGQLALVRDLGPAYLAFVDQVRGSGSALLDREQATLGFHHVQLTSRMLQEWRLPEHLARAVDHPREVAAVLELAMPQRALAQVLHLANLVADVFADGSSGALESFLIAAGQYAGLSLADLEMFVGEIQTRVEELASVLVLELPGDVNYQALLAQAHARLADVAERAASSLVADMEELDLLEEILDLERSTAAVGLRGSQLVASADLSPAPATTDGQRVRAGRTPFPASDPGLEGRLEAAIRACRQEHWPFSLMLVAIDDFENVIVRRGTRGADGFVEFLLATIAELTPRSSHHLQVSDSAVALVLENCDRQHAVRLGRLLLDSAVERFPRVGPAPPVTISIGIASTAVPSKNLVPATLLDSARRCLAAAQLSNGGSLKSIDLL